MPTNDCFFEHRLKKKNKNGICNIAHGTECFILFPEEGFRINYSSVQIHFKWYCWRKSCTCTSFYRWLLLSLRHAACCMQAGANHCEINCNGTFKCSNDRSPISVLFSFIFALSNSVTILVHILSIHSFVAFRLYTNPLKIAHLEIASPSSSLIINLHFVFFSGQKYEIHFNGTRCEAASETLSAGWMSRNIQIISKYTLLFLLYLYVFA